MAEVVELRVHGVGGSTPEALLGIDASTDAVLVAGDDAAGFYARRTEPTVEGYVWGGLTSGGIAQTFWVVLLPFTLLNVAGWMYPAADQSRSPLARSLSRTLLGILGISLTLGYVLWIFACATLVFGAPHFASSAAWLSPREQVSASLAVVALIGVVVYQVSRSRQSGFEGVRGPVAADIVKGSFASSLVAPQELEHPALWSSQQPVLQLLRVHIVLAGVCLAGLGGWALLRAGQTDAVPRLDPLFRVNGFVQLSIGLVVLVLYLCFERPSGFRFAGPAVMAITAVAVTAGFFAGGWHLIATAVNKQLPTPQEPLGEMAGVFGAGLLAFIFALAIWAIWHVCRVPGQLRAMRAEAVPANSAPPGGAHNGLSPRTYRRTARIRAFATGPRHVDLVITAGATIFAVLAIPTLAAWVTLPDLLVRWGRSSVYLITGGVIPFLIYRARRPGTGRRIAIVWDLLTFFPRRFHPFAVRPYAERAVPELQGRIVRHREAGRRVIVCGHSQGSVISLAALAQLRAAPKVTNGVAFVTFGSPLVQLHARFFPELFGDPGLFPRLRSALAQTGLPCTSWRNFYRRTDYVGQQLFACTDAGSCDEELPDPPQGPSLAPARLEAPLAPAADPPPAAWVRPTVHSYYLGEVRLQAWVADLKREPM